MMAEACDSHIDQDNMEKIEIHTMKISNEQEFRVKLFRQLAACLRNVNHHVVQA